MKKERVPRAIFVASMLIFGTLGLFVRQIPLASGELALYRAVLAALLMGGYRLLTGQKLPLTEIRGEIPLLLASGAALAINWILLFEAYRYTTVSLATLSYSFAPVLVTVASPLLFHERMTRRQILCFVMSTLGLIIMTGAAGAEDGHPQLHCPADRRPDLRHPSGGGTDGATGHRRRDDPGLYADP